MPLTFVNSNMYAKALTISSASVDSALTSFAVQVKIAADTDLGSHCRSDGYDVRFTLEDGTLLPYKRRRFSISSGEASGFFVVQIPTILSSSDTTFYIQYGNASATDVSTNPHDSNTKGRWPLDETGTVTTWSDEIGTAALTSNGATAGTGTIDGCATLSGSSQFAYHNASTPAALRPANVTVSAWVKASAIGGSSMTIAANIPRGSWSAGRGYFMSISSTGKLTGAIGQGSGALLVTTGSTTLSAGVWYHVAMTYDGTNLRVFVNGVQDATTAPGVAISYADSTTEGPNPQTFYLGAYHDATNSGPASNTVLLFNGSIDELGVDATAREAAWIKFSYANADGGGITIGSEQGSDFVTVTRPNGGEVFVVGDTESITWEKGIATEVSVDVSRDNGSSWTEIDSGNTGTSFDWEVTDPVGTQAKVRVRATSGGSATDASDAAFRIATTSAAGGTGGAPVIGGRVVRRG